MLPDSFVLRTCLIVLAPFAIYTLVIARMNRKSYPTVVGGVSDCAGLILAFSGVLFYLAPGLLTGFNFWPHDVWLYNHYSALKGASVEEAHARWNVWWLSVWTAYAIIVVGGISLLLWNRRRATAIYNVDAGHVDMLLTQTFDRLGIRWSPSERGFTLTDASLLRFSTPSSPSNGDWQPSPGVQLGPITVELERWHAIRHMVLFWSKAHHPIRTAFEQFLNQNLHTFGRRTRPTANVMMIVAASLFLTLFALVVAYQYARYLESRV